MTFDIRVVSTYDPRRCGIATFSRNLITSAINLTAEVDTARVAAIDKGGLEYFAPVDLRIDQHLQASWGKITSSMLAKAAESDRDWLYSIQHEFGLDGKDGAGDNYARLAEDLSWTRRFKEGRVITLTQLHTVLRNPNDHQRDILHRLGESSDALIVTAASAIDTLASGYDVDPRKIKFIPHGIRTRNPSEHDRLNVKKELGLEGITLLTTLGLKGPDKGIQFAIPAYAKVVENSFTDEQRANTVYLVAGECHPEFVKADGGKPYAKYMTMMEKALGDSNLTYCKVSNLEEFKGLNLKEQDIVFLDSFLDEKTLLKMYTASNLVVLPYLNKQQVSSGVLADTIGSGRVAIVGKSVCSVEMLCDNLIDPDEKGLIGIGDSHACGFLVDPGKFSVEQIATAIHYALSEEDARLSMERRASSKGYVMSQPYVTLDLMRYAEWCRVDKQTPRGRGRQFEFNSDSPYARRVAKLLTAK
jgi:glycosyltransferase involved in cell wall biosynthesis